MKMKIINIVCIYIPNKITICLCILYQYIMTGYHDVYLVVYIPIHGDVYIK